VNTGRVTVLGASSQIGLFALPMLAAGGWQVIAISRHGKPADYPDIEDVRWNGDVNASLPEVSGPQALFSAGPIDLTCRHLEAHPQTRRAVVFSSSSVLSKLASPDPQEQQQMRAIAAAEQRVLDLCDASQASLCILRPTLVYGCGLDRNLSLLMSFIRRFGWLPVSSQAQGLRQPVHAADLARTATRALEPGVPERMVSEACGATTLTYRDMVRALFAAAGKTERLVSLPPALLAGMVRLASWSGPGKGLRTSMVYRQASDLVFDDSPARQLLGHQPRPYVPVMADFQRPGEALLRRLRNETATR
jgi:nucleoside-diphosphate-sugar epimerase